MSKPWPLNDAKTHLSEVIDLAQTEPQIVTKHGKNTAVVLSFEAFELLESCNHTQNAWDVLRPKEPILEDDEHFERIPDSIRDFNFDD